jgi:cell division protein FtsN
MRNMVRPMAFLTAASLLVSGCAETQLGLQLAKSAARDNTAPRDAPAVNSDATIAPEEFDATGLTIWDGARTLQGVWIAHPLANRARRVRVVNTVTGQTVEGAMFRRDPSLSGPSILVSSDAATGLGLKPGDPTALRIVALRDPAAQPAPVATTPPAPVETAALPAPPAPAPAPAATFEAAPSPVPAPGGTLTPSPVAPTPAPEAVSAPAPAAAEATATETVPKPTPRPARIAATPSTATAAGNPDAALPAGNYVQAGAFGVQLNAATLVTKLQAKGLPAQFVRRDVNGAKLNIVMIGPLSGDAAIERAKNEAAAAGVAGARKVTL